MKIVYVAGVVTDVLIDNLQLQSRMTQAERLAIFGCALPDAASVSALTDLENQKPGATVIAVCNAMVAAGSITQARANVLSA